MNKNEYWSKIPNNLVWISSNEDKIKGEIPLCKDNDILFATIVYMNINTTNIGEVKFTFEDLITFCGLKVRTGKNNSIEQFKKVLSYLQQLKFITSDNDFLMIKPKELIKIDFNITYKKDEDSNDIEWFKLYYKNLIKIINSDINVDKLKLLRVYCYYLSRVKRNNEEQKTQLEEYMIGDDTVVESFYDKYKTICNDLGISESLLRKYLDILEELELIFTDNIGQVKNSDGKEWTANNVYVDNKVYLKRALECSKEYYENELHCTVLGRKVKTKSTISKGYQGKIRQENNKGKDTTKLENKLNELI